MSRPAPQVQLPTGVDLIAREICADLQSAGIWDLDYSWFAFKLWQSGEPLELDWWPQHWGDGDRGREYLRALAAAYLPGGIVQEEDFKTESVLAQADDALQIEGTGLTWRNEDEGPIPGQREICLWVPDRELWWRFGNVGGLIAGVNALLEGRSDGLRFIGLRPGEHANLHFYVLCRLDIELRLAASAKFSVRREDDPLAGPKP